MANETQSLDQVLEGMYVTNDFRAAGVNISLDDFCQYWPYIRQFLEWAKAQTSNFIVRMIIEGLIRLGNSKCG